ncbi:hypothetical protein WJX73_000842 [Symbiochloris irregularis]|uniref:Uncharacterized protein n=1 Tax=Symbiochloris irregularis TaxID=706552 RepID=A0AAW1PHV4_9CHLO
MQQMFLAHQRRAGFGSQKNTRDLILTVKPGLLRAASLRTTSKRTGSGQSRRLQRVAAHAGIVMQGPQNIGLLIECDGVLLDVHKDGHRVAFNRAFQQVGLEGTQWTPAVYHEFLRFGDGSAEALLSAYFSTVGWPSNIRTQERKPFVQKLHELKRENLLRMVEAGTIPLRPGAERLLQDAVEAGTPVGLIAGTCSVPDEAVVLGALKALGDELAPRVHVFTNALDNAGGGSVRSLDGVWEDPDASEKLAWAARGAGFTALAVPPARSTRGRFNGAHAVFDGFGPGGGLTYRRAVTIVTTHPKQARSLRDT